MIIYRSINTHAGTISLHIPEVHAAISLSYLKDQAILLHEEDKAYHNLMKIQEYDEKRDRQCRTLPSFMYLSNHTLALPTLSARRMISPFRCPVASTTETYYYTKPITSWIQHVHLVSDIGNNKTESMIISSQSPSMIISPQSPPTPPPSPLKSSDIFKQTLEDKFTENLINTCAEFLSQIGYREASISRKRRMGNDNNDIMEQNKIEN